MREMITYNGTKNGEPYRIELEAENLDLIEHDAKIRTDAIDKCINTIKSNWAFWNVGVIASVIKTLEQLKEQEMSEKELRKELREEIEKFNKEYYSCSCHIGEEQSDGTEHDCDYYDHCIGCEYFY